MTLCRCSLKLASVIFPRFVFEHSSSWVENWTWTALDSSECTLHSRKCMISSIFTKHYIFALQSKGFTMVFASKCWLITSSFLMEHAPRQRSFRVSHFQSSHDNVELDIYSYYVFWKPLRTFLTLYPIDSRWYPLENNWLSFQREVSSMKLTPPLRRNLAFLE